MMTLFDEDYVRELYVKDCIKKYAKEYAKDYAKEYIDDEARETAIRMIKDGDIPLEKIAKFVLSLSLNELKELEAEVIQSA